MRNARKLGVIAISMLGIGIVASAKPKEEQASVKLGENGKLEYIADARENMIPDFSRAGYMGGGVKIPDLPVRITLEPRPGMNMALEMYNPDDPPDAGEGDDFPRIQAAIDKVSAMPLDKNGLRGAVLLKKGLYRTSKGLSIKASGVVLRGEGQGKGWHGNSLPGGGEG
jgi:hypothetical protein